MLVDRFDESMVVAEHFLRPSWPGLQLHHPPQNVLRSVSYSVADREHEFRQRCGEALYRSLKRLVELDERLCDAAAAELDRRIALVPAFAARLNEFRDRCVGLAVSA